MNVEIVTAWAHAAGSFAAIARPGVRVGVLAVISLGVTRWRARGE